MRVYRSTPTVYYTKLRNETLQDNEAGLSLGAIGLLGHLLSLEDGTPVDIKSLSKLFPDSQARIAGYLHELAAAGHLVRRKVRDPETRTIRTVQAIYSERQAVPGRDMSLVSAEVEPSLSPVRLDSSSAPPLGVSTGIKNPPVPPPLPFEELGGGDDVPAIDDREHAAGAALLSRLGRQEPKLALGTLEILPLVPLVVEWLARGVSEAQMRMTLAEGLPKKIFSPGAFLENRLRRKMPELPPAPAPKPDVCDSCHRPVTGACGFCLNRSSDVPTTFTDATAREIAMARSKLLESRARLAS